MLFVVTYEHIIEFTITPQGLYIHIHWMNLAMSRYKYKEPPIRGSCSLHVLAPIPFFISRIDYNPSVIWISPKNSTLRTKITSPIAKSTSPGLSDMTFFASCTENLLKHSCQQNLDQTRWDYTTNTHHPFLMFIVVSLWSCWNFSHCQQQFNSGPL